MNSPAPTPSPAPHLIGTAVSRVDGPAKVTGKADFTADYSFPNMAWAVVVKSEIACGQIDKLDLAAAKQAPGVVAIYTFQNRPTMYPPKKLQGGGVIVSEQLAPLADAAIHYYGQDIAYVVAESYEEARAAAGMVKATYAPQAAALKLAEAQPKAPDSVNGEKPHLNKQAAVLTSVESVFANTPVKVDATYVTPFLHHQPMEPHAVVAKWDDDRLTFHTATQWIYGTRNFLAQSLAIPQDHVRVISHYIGGGFGSKGSSWMFMLMTAAIGRELKRPVKFVMERENMFTSNGYRPQTLQHIQLAANASGQLQAVRHYSKTSQSVVGAFVEPTGHSSSTVIYASPNIEVDHQVYPLNLNAPTFMRAPGESPGIFVLESAMDELAVELKMDPLQLRLANMTANHPMTNLPFSSRHLEECYRAGAEKFGWSGRPMEIRAKPQGEWLVGWGMATASYPAHRSAAKVRARLLANGTAEIDSATQDLGTGTYTIMAQSAADELGLPIDKIRVLIGDSTEPESPVSGGSQTAGSILPAVQLACRSALAKLADLATADAHSPLHGQTADNLEPVGGALRLKSDPARQQGFTDILAQAGQGAVEAIGSAEPSSEKKDKREQSFFSRETTSYQSFGAFFVEARVHQLTGETRLNRIVVAMDIGQPLNLKTARSQILGGATFGIGAALSEDSILDEQSGRWITHDLGTYHVPVNADVPEIDVLFVGPPDYKFNSLGARGVGEIGNTGITAAIGNAIYHATGIRMRQLPFTPDRFLSAQAESKIDRSA